MKNHCFINNAFVEEKDAVVSVFDRGLRYGDGVFETIRAYEAGPLFLKEHIQRLEASADALKIPFKRKGLEGIIKKLLTLNGLVAKDSCLRVMLTRGADRGKFLPSKKTKPTLIVTALPLDIEAMRGMQKKGLRAVVVNGPAPVISGLKTLNCLGSIIARMEALEKDAHEAIFTDEKTGMLECASGNVFFVKRGVIKTPPLWTGILPGITRQAVIRLARERGLPLEETLVPQGELHGMDEAFLTNSLVEIAPLVSIDGRAVGKGRPGRVTRMLQEAYRLAYAPPKNPLTSSRRSPRARDGS